MAAPFAPLFEPIEIKSLALRNRVVAPPMVQVRSLTSRQGVAWYRRLAAGGAGLVIVEATPVDIFGRELTEDALRALAEAIHEQGAAAAIQLFPTRLGDPTRPDELGLPALMRMVDHFARAAELSQRVGFDGVEPHGAHGYVLNQFFMPDLNHRGDAYGGSLENRCRLAEQIVKAIRQAVGEALVVFYRHTPVSRRYTLEASLELAGRLVAAGVDVLDISPARDERVAALAAPFRERFDVPVIAVGGMEDPGAAAEALRAGRCDLVAVGRQLITDARWPSKVQAGRLDDVVPCDKCSVGCFGNLRDGEPVACVKWNRDDVAPFVV